MKAIVMVIDDNGIKKQFGVSIDEVLKDMRGDTDAQ